MRSLAFTLFVLLTLGVVRADDAGPRAVAKQHFDAGREAFQRGQFAIAYDEFQRAYTMAPAPPLLYNIGRCLESLGRLQEAIDYYERYTSVTPDAEITAHVGALKARVENPTLAAPMVGQATYAAPIVATTPPARTPVYKRWWLWTTVGVVVAAGVAVGLGVGLTRGGGDTFAPLNAR